MPLDPKDLRELADRLEQEAATAAEEKQAAAIQAAVDRGQDALADRLAERLEARIDARLSRDDATIDKPADKPASVAGDDNGDDANADDDTGDDDGDGIMPGRWRARKVFGAKLYSGPPEPETVRFRNEKGQIQSRPGRVPGRPYQTEWEAVEEPDDAAEEDAA